MHIDEERMSDVFTKYHIRGPWPFHPVFHKFGAPDGGAPHDHPWSFRSIILCGGYVEDVFSKEANGKVETIHRKPGDSFWIDAEHIHRIVDLPNGECWTMILPGHGQRKSGFWQFREDGPYHRKWDEQDWTKA